MQIYYYDLRFVLPQNQTFNDIPPTYETLRAHDVMNERKRTVVKIDTRVLMVDQYVHGQWSPQQVIQPVQCTYYGICFLS